MALFTDFGGGIPSDAFVTKYIRMPDMLTELHQPEANKNKLRKKYAAP